MTERTVAKVIGGLFIVASATAIVGGSLLTPVDDMGSVTTLADQGTRVAAGALLELVLVWSVIGIAALFFPVLKRRDEGLALAYVGARIVEGSLLLVASLSAVVAENLSRNGGGDDGTLGSLLSAVRDRSYVVGSLLAFGVGALILYGLLYRSGLVPDWLALWGLVGAALITLRGVVEVCGTDLSGAVQGLLAAPIGLNEMVLAVWLIAKGFGTPTASATWDPSRRAVGPTMTSR